MKCLTAITKTEKFTIIMNLARYLFMLSIKKTTLVLKQRDLSFQVTTVLLISLKVLVKDSKQAFQAFKKQQMMIKLVRTINVPLKLPIKMKMK